MMKKHQLTEQMQFLQERLKVYYEKQFQIQEVLKYINPSTFSNREFGFELLNGKFTRNLSFKDPEDLRTFLIENTPLGVYIGAVFEPSPSWENPIHTLTWKGREFIIDIDLDVYDSVRNCSCKGTKNMCHSCWKLIPTAIKFIDETLNVDFGFEKRVWFFSGRRGVHCWIFDDDAFTLTDEQRASIVEYLSIIRGETEDARIQERGDLPEPLKQRIYRVIIASYLLEASEEELLMVGFSKEHVKSIIDERTTDMSPYLLLKLPTRGKRQNIKILKVYENILRVRFPRLDTKVSIDVNRLLRMPYSIHGKTGRIVKPIPVENVDTFDPFDEPSIFNTKKRNLFQSLEPVKNQNA